MLITMKRSATADQVQHVCDIIEAMGFEARPMPGGVRTAIGVVGNDTPVTEAPFRGLEGVSRVIAVSAPYKQVSREWKPQPTVVELENGVQVGGKDLVVMGGPCAVESEEQLMAAAKVVAEAGGVILRGGAFKPRTSPYSFQGLGNRGLDILAMAREEYGLAIITEAMDMESADLVAEKADIIQIGARNMQNYPLLRHIGKLQKPVMLKRGMSATIKEWLLAAEYILSGGNEQVILCERGIRGFDDATRNVMDVGAIALVKELSHLPVIADPSHATGRRSLVAPVARASVAVGADGVIVETHPKPHEALSDGPQALFPSQFKEMVESLGAIAATLDRPMATLS
jgi:3-deoxy-7-phosphoheptulonate synthase